MMNVEAGKLRLPAVAALVLGIVCCRSAVPQAEDEAAVREALSRFVHSLNNLDWEPFRACFAADATLFNPEIPEVSTLGRIDGKAAVEASFRAVFESARRESAGPPYLHIVPRNVRVQMLAGAAVVTFEFDRDRGSFGRRTVIFRKAADGWQIIHLHASNVSRAPGGESPTVNSIVDFLLTSAATDFHAHRPPYPARFRDVRLGHVTTSGGEKQYRLCGQFLPAQDGGKAEWTAFATIKTSGYEQWIGAQSASFCQGPSFRWDEVGDLSSSLQTRLDSLR